jgi:hypothetical protein
MVGWRSLAAAGTAGILGALTFAVSSTAMPGVETKRQACTVLAARDRILASTLPQSVKDAAGGMNGGGVDRIICRDVTADRIPDMTVLIASGGAARVTAWVVFRARRTSWQLTLRRLDLYRASVGWVKGDLVETVAVLRKTDQVCCPTGGHDHTRFHWKHSTSRFLAVSFWHTK